MEKLIVKTFQVLTLAALAAFSVNANAGTPFRMHSKAPIHQVKQYVFGYGGVNLGSEYQTTGNFLEVHGYTPRDIDIDWDTDAGFTFGGGIGFYSNALGGSRFEIEGSYSENTISDLTYGGDYYDYGLGESKISTMTVMANFLKEVPLGRATGYFGGGIGGANSRFEGDLIGVPVDERDGGFAWQFIAGVDIPINDCVALFTQYRYMSIHGIEYNTAFGDFPFGADDAITSHSIMAGIRFSY